MKVFKLSVLELAAYYEKELSEQQLRIYSEQLAEHLTPDEVVRSVKAYISDPANEFFPRPISKLIALVKSPLSNMEQSQHVASLIKKAAAEKMSSWSTGHYWGKHPESGEDLFYFQGKDQSFWTWREAAENYFGQLGLAIVDHLGGWQRVCEAFNTTQESIVWAQLLKAGEAVLAIYKHEKQNTLPQLPIQKSVLRLVEIKSLNEKTGE